MSLTQQDVQQLCAAFRRDDHEFVEGRTYLTEDAITARIESVDFNWSFEIQEAIAYGDSISVRGVLTIKGVSRAGIGGNPVQRETKEWENKKWTGRYVPLSAYAVAENGVNAYKAAATDCLKRCARLFGVGRYLLDAPKENEFNSWLAQKQKELGVGGVDVATGEVAPAPMLTTPLQAGGQWTHTPENATSPKAMREREAAKEVENKPEATEDAPPPADEFDDIALSTRTPQQAEIGLVEPPKHPKNTRTWDIGRVKTHTIQDRKHIPVKGATPHFDALIAKLESSLRITDTSATEEVCAAIDAYYAEKLKATG